MLSIIVGVVGSSDFLPRVEMILEKAFQDFSKFWCVRARPTRLMRSPFSVQSCFSSGEIHCLTWISYHNINRTSKVEDMDELVE